MGSNFKRAELELGNIMFNTNTNKYYECPKWVVALLSEIDNQLDRVMWNINQEKYDSPFSNTANKFKNEVFEVEAYSWDDNYEQPYNFKWKDIEISWYKYLGRDTTINGEYKPEYLIQMFNECIDSLLAFEEIELSKKDEQLINRENINKNE